MANGIEWDRVGELMADNVAREAWVEMVKALHEAALPGGPLDGWVFHGAAAATVDDIVREGMRTSYAIAGGEDDGEWTETEGAHFGPPAAAAFYAEDRIDSTDDPCLELAILAVKISDLESIGDFAVDGQTLDCPLDSRLERSADEIHAAWDRSARGWRDCLDLFGSLLVLAPVPPEVLRPLKTRADVDALIAEAAPRRIL